MADSPGSRALADWIGRARELAVGNDAATAELAAITAHDTRPAVRVAVTSMAARDRQPVLDSLLGTPPGSLQPTDEAERPVTGVAADLGVEVSGVPAPDGGDPKADTARWAALTAADALVMVVHGTAPMTMAEVGVVAEAVQRGFTPGQVRIMVVHIDLVDPDDRAAVLDYVGQRARAIAPGLTVWPAGPDAPEAAGAAVASWIVGEVLPVATRGRDGQVARQLIRLLGTVGQQASQAATAAERRRAQRDEEEAALAEARADELLRFDEVRENVRERRNATTAAFGAARDSFQKELGILLDHQLDSTQDPARWWHKELPYQLQTRLTSWDQQMRGMLQGRVTADADRLRAELAPLTEASPASGDPLDFPRPAPPPEGQGNAAMAGNPDLSADAMHKRRVRYTMVPTVTALGAIVAFPPLAPVVMLSAVLARMGLVELRLPALAREQRAVIGPQLASLLTATLSEYSDAVRAAVDVAYQQQEDNVGWLREQRRTAEAGQQPAAEQPSAGPDATHWAAIATDCAALADEIGGTLEAEAAESESAAVPGTPAITGTPAGNADTEPDHEKAGHAE